jgi:malate/lactate dehydrogenase
VKIVIAGGGGGVGASVAFNLLRGPGAHEVTLVDRRPEMAASHALDLEQVLQQGASGSIRQGTGEDVAQAEIVVVSAAAPLFDRVTVDGVPVTLSDRQCARARDFVEYWYVRHVALDSGRSSTWTSGLGVARMVGAIAGGGAEPWPASVLLHGEYGLEDVSLSVPVSLGPGGAQRIHQWELTGGQQAQLAAAAEFVRDAAAALSY